MVRLPCSCGRQALRCWRAALLRSPTCPAWMFLTMVRWEFTGRGALKVKNKLVHSLLAENSGQEHWKYVPYIFCLFTAILLHLNGHCFCSRPCYQASSDFNCRFISYRNLIHFSCTFAQLCNPFINAKPHLAIIMVSFLVWL